ncbi:MAG: signal recognition particle protein, partial [Clostridium sp.]
LVIDAMTGQDAVNVAEHFNESLDLSGVVLTKLDGDTRGGAAISVKAVTGKPIKFAGVGEKLSDFEVFHPDRMASRILGMGDVLSLIEKAQESIDEKKALELHDKMMSKQYNLEDFLDQLRQMKKLGSVKDLMGMIPGMDSGKLKDVNIDEREIFRVEAIISSMTTKERQQPSIINASRKRRIAAGSGTTIQHVNKILNQFEQSKKLMKQFGDMQKNMKKGKFKFPLFK